MSIIIGIDYGDTRIGLALCDPEEKLARRYRTLLNSPHLLADLRTLIEKERVEKAVIGLPLGFAGASEQTRKVERFIATFQEETGLPTTAVNEVLTSKMAEENLHQSGVKNVKEVLDQEAARIILQDFLDAQERTR